MGRVVVLEDGVTAAPMQYNADEMAYIESRKLSREEVAAVMDLPPPSIQILDHATFSNITENMRSLYRDSMQHRIEFIESVVNWHVGREFNSPKVMRFDMSKELRGSFEQRAESMSKLVNSGIYKPAEARQEFDLNDAGAVADELYANQAMQPLGMMAGPAGGPGGAPALESGTVVPSPNGDGDGIAVPSPAVAKYMRELGGLVGRGQTLQAAARFVINKTGDQDGVREACEWLLERRL
jgi:hypothetical protein